MRFISLAGHWALTRLRFVREVKVPEGKEKITIRLDGDIVDWFRNVVDQAGGGNYQTLMNQALREYIEGKAPSFEDTQRRIIREELAARLSAA